MKYLKTFESIKSREIFDPIIREMNDIFLPLTDIGLQTTKQIQIGQIVIYITAGVKFRYNKSRRYNEFDKFHFSDIKDPINHLISYMVDNGYGLIRSMYRVEISTLSSKWEYLYNLTYEQREKGIPPAPDDIFNDLNYEVDSFEIIFDNPHRTEY